MNKTFDDLQKLNKLIINNKDNFFQFFLFRDLKRLI